jgi:ABC-type sulfate/molybdate transport systems ATPase subunit
LGRPGAGQSNSLPSSPTWPSACASPAQLAQAVNDRVGEAAGILGLNDYLKRYPRQLSGGQRQRVAMGRAIVRKPQVFLFDEPLSNLDAKLRVAMHTEIKALHQRLKTTSIYVTHDQIEAMYPDKLVPLTERGRIPGQEVRRLVRRVPRLRHAWQGVDRPADRRQRRGDGLTFISSSEVKTVPVGVVTELVEGDVYTGAR